MLICLWKDCEFASEDMVAFQEHVITEHALQQQRPQRQQLNLDKQNDVGTEAAETVGVKQMAKLNLLDEDKMIKTRGNRKIIFLAIEVWVDVLGFVRRIQLARNVSLLNRRFQKICWPRLHGEKVEVHKAWPIIIGHRHELGQPPTAILLKNHKHKEVPFPECPPPDYITGFGSIQINFLDQQVWAFLSLITPRITNKVVIQFLMEMQMTHLDANSIKAK